MDDDMFGVFVCTDDERGKMAAAVTASAELLSDDRQRRTARWMFSQGCCVRCSLRIAGVHQDEVCRLTMRRDGEDASGGDVVQVLLRAGVPADADDGQGNDGGTGTGTDVCVVCVGLLGDPFLDHLVRSAAETMCEEGHIGGGGEEDGEDGEPEGPHETPAKRQRMNDNDHLNTIDNTTNGSESEPRSVRDTFSLDVSTQEASSTTVRQSLILSRLAAADAMRDDGGGEQGVTTEMKSVLKALLTAKFPGAMVKAINDKTAMKTKGLSKSGAGAAASRRRPRIDFSFDPDGNLNVRLNLAYSHNTEDIQQLGHFYLEAEEEVKAREKELGAGGASGTSAPSAAPIVSLLPQKKRNDFINNFGYLRGKKRGGAGNRLPSVARMIDALGVLPPRQREALSKVLLDKPVSVLVPPSGVGGESEAPQASSCVSYSMKVSRPSLYCSGRYVKHQRGLSQTPWILDNVVMGDGSVEECFAPLISSTLRGSGYSFISSGREDIDVRMLGNGRPFAVEVKNPKRFLHLVPDLAVDDADAIRRKAGARALSERVQAEINDVSSNTANRGRVSVRDLQFFCSKRELDVIKNAGEGKQKSYRALIWSSRRITQGDMDRVNRMSNVKVLQNTPIRVLHRRSPLIREKIIHEMRMEPICGAAGPGAEAASVKDRNGAVADKDDEGSHYAIINMRTSAGTYIKEFVHGDIGRTKPSLGHLLAGADGTTDTSARAGARTKCISSMQILQLDVSDVIV